MTDIAYLGEAPGKVGMQQGKVFAGPPGKLLKGMATTAGLPWEDAWKGYVMGITPKAKLEGHEIRKQLDIWVPKLKLPKAKVYIAAGNLATQTLLTGNMDSRHRGVLKHAASVVSAEEARGLVDLPPGSHVIPIRHPFALLSGGDQSFPSTRMSLQRAALLLAGALPEAPEPIFRLFATDIEPCWRAAQRVGRVTFDLETPYSHDKIYIGAFTAGGITWVFDEVNTVILAKKFFAQDKITIGGQNSATFDEPVLHRRGVVEVLDSKAPRYDTRWMDAFLRPRMPHDLASLAAHWLPWGPPNWKPMISEAVHPMSETGR